jgi:hypothetical protein
MSQNPVPPKHLGSRSFSHAIQWIFLWPASSPHQIYLIILVISSHRVGGSMKTPITYVGIACATDFINTSFAPVDMHLSSQLVRRFTSLSFVGLNHSLRILPCGVGRPKYFSSSATCETFKISLVLSLSASSQFFPNIIEHYAGFIS